VVVGADWQEDYLPRVDTVEGQALLEPFVQRADLVIFDNRSCLLDVEGEKDAGAWQPTQDYLLRLRRRGKASILVHHANRQGGARGLGKAEDVMDVVVKLSRPEDYTADQGARFRVDFDKARGLYGEAVQPFIASLTDAGWAVSSVEAAESSGLDSKLKAYLRTAAELEELPKSASAAVKGAGVNRQGGLQAFARLVREGTVVKADGGGYVLT
jgi:putative DNA primase/helicase